MSGHRDDHVVALQAAVHTYRSRPAGPAGRARVASWAGRRRGAPPACAARASSCGICDACRAALLTARAAASAHLAARRRYRSALALVLADVKDPAGRVRAPVSPGPRCGKRA